MPLPRRHLAVLACCALVVVAHQVTHWHWFIEDAAICFSYARNLATGQGAVPFLGGERIEAYSNPTWIALLTLVHALGIDGWSSAKPLGVLLGIATLWPVWQLTKAALPEHTGPGALAGPIVLAFSSPFAVWATSGLENALFGLVLASALWRATVEARDGGAPWSAALYLVLAWTRPEGTLYAAIGGAYFLLQSVRSGRGLRPVATWLVMFFGPSLALEALRLAYFAWPLPNTYYAKVSSPVVYAVDWESMGWQQLRHYASSSWQGWLAPVSVFALVGARGWRARVGLAVVVAFAVWFSWDAPTGPVTTARCAALIGVGALLPFLALGRPGGEVRARCAHTLWFGITFSLVSNGDWMIGFRWMSLVAPVASVLFATGVVDLVDRLELRASGTARWGSVGWLAASLGVGAVVPPNLRCTIEHRLDLMNVRAISPQTVKLRVDYLQSVVQDTFFEGRVKNLDIDQGAFLWWAPEFEQHDLAALVDVPMAHHWWQQRPFVREYLFEEVRPTFVNLGHNSRWSQESGLHLYPEWADYFEMPGYPAAGGGQFTGIFMLRSVVLAPRFEGTPDRRIVFEGGWTLEGFEVPEPWEQGAYGYIETPLSTAVTREAGSRVRLGVFVANAEGVRLRWRAEGGYRLPPVHEWRPGEVFRGRDALSIGDLAPGTYDLGFVLFDGDRVLAPEQVPDGAVVNEAAEIVFPGAVRVVPPSETDALVTQARQAALAHAAAERCEDAESAWTRIRRLRSGTDSASIRAVVAPAIADCLARRGDPDSLARAHTWDPHSAELARVGDGVAERLLAEGYAARDAEDWALAYERFAAVLRFQPWRAWVRRHAEEARDRKLGIHDDVMVGRHGYDWEVRGLDTPWY